MQKRYLINDTLSAINSWPFCLWWWWGPRGKRCKWFLLVFIHYRLFFPNHFWSYDQRNVNGMHSWMEHSLRCGYRFLKHWRIFPCVRYTFHPWEIRFSPDCFYDASAKAYAPAIYLHYLLSKASPQSKRYLLRRTKTLRTIRYWWKLLFIIVEAFKITTCILRFVNILKNREPCSGPLSTMEMLKGRLIWDLCIPIRTTQTCFE